MRRRLEMIRYRLLWKLSKRLTRLAEWLDAEANDAEPTWHLLEAFERGTPVTVLPGARGSYIWRCEHMTMSGLVYGTTVRCYMGCEMQPIPINRAA